jgi:hypothetical protein
VVCILLETKVLYKKSLGPLLFEMPLRGQKETLAGINIKYQISLRLTPYSRQFQPLARSRLSALGAQKRVTQQHGSTLPHNASPCQISFPGILAHPMGHARCQVLSAPLSSKEIAEEISGFLLADAISPTLHISGGVY